ncbi:MAG: hypothetical protein ACR2RE_27320 [Geminicoccaceae bacterium]
MQRRIRRINREYSDLLRELGRRLEGQRVRYKGRKGRVQTASLNPKLTRVDIVNDDGSLELDVDALLPEYDP